MDIKEHYTKTLGPKEAEFILELYEKGHSTFTLKDASEVTRLSGQSFRNFIYRLVKKGVLTRLSSGLYNIVPFEMGHTKEFMGNQYVVAREIVRQKFKGKTPQYYISHASAMDIHQMVTQPQLVVYTTVTKQIKQRPNILGTEFRFVTCKSNHYFGFKKFWVTKSELVLVSNLERTIIDGLKLPEYCSGITEVAKGFWMKRSEVDLKKLVDYAEVLDLGSLYSRLGFLLEIYKIDCPQEIERLQKKLTRSFVLLDPTLLDEGKYLSRWRLRVNIPEGEFLSVIRT